ncbi:hypothetical protein L2E82_06995 [Cichorium intybus]|uniref:Uncharacterized protein n=1 Tax=Cichorium intybus TaxID=13427 RepID=A0ACB9G4R1_CICIN|nr:hypothetical protein L2E82_06995 [Cichorium intybus]
MTIIIKINKAVLLLLIYYLITNIAKIRTGGRSEKLNFDLNLSLETHKVIDVDELVKNSYVVAVYNRKAPTHVYQYVLDSEVLSDTSLPQNPVNDHVVEEGIMVRTGWHTNHRIPFFRRGYMSK